MVVVPGGTVVVDVVVVVVVLLVVFESPETESRPRCVMNACAVATCGGVTSVRVDVTVRICSAPEVRGVDREV